MKISILFWFLLSTSLVFIYCDQKRVLLIGLDGLNPSCLKNTKNFEYFFENGAYTYTAHSTKEAMSSTGWSAILCSMESEDSKIYGNSWIPPEINDPLRKNSLKCLFETIKKQNSKLKTGFYYDWDWLEYFGNKYMGDSYIDDEFSCLYYDFYGCDQVIKMIFRNVLENIQHASSYDYDFFFLYLGAIDFAGHNEGWCGEEYMRQVEIVNEYVNYILKVFQESKLLDNTYVIITADHGADIGSKDHGLQNDANLFVPFFIVGPDVKKKYEISETVHLIDLAPTITRLLGLKKHEKWKGEFIKEFLENYEEDDNLNTSFNDEGGRRLLI